MIGRSRLYCRDCFSSLFGSKRSTELEIVIDISLLVAGVEGHLGTGPAFTFSLNIDILDIVDRESFTLRSVEMTRGLFKGSLHTRSFIFGTLGLLHAMQ